ncbi:MAG: phage holin family protein [Vicinamibacteria bacterium]
MSTLPQEEERPRSALSLVRDVVQSLTHMVEDSTELVAATVREELTRFRVELARNAVAGVALLAGTSLLTAGLAMFLNQLLGSWPLTLSLFGALYLGIGLALMGKRK